MKKQNRKQGFTLVELLVVIAILAILATVSVVGYTAFIKRAHQANALAEANQLKTAIRADLISGNDFVISETKDETSGVVTARRVITLNNERYTVMDVTVPADGSEPTKTTVAAGENLSTNFAELNDKDFADLVAPGHATITVGENGLSLIYNYTANDNTIKVVIDLNADTATIQK